MSFNVRDEYGPGSWRGIERKLARHQKDPKSEEPTNDELASALRRSYPIPQIARNYIAGLIDRSIKRRPGPKPPDAEQKALRQALTSIIKREYDELNEQNKQLRATEQSYGAWDSHETTLEQLAERHDLTINQIERFVFPPNK